MGSAVSSSPRSGSETSREPMTGPVRTCVGCRGRESRSTLLRVVVVETDAGARVVPDHRGRLPGRGAWLHPSRSCAELAVRRKAFTRALRRPAALDLPALLGWVEAGGRQHVVGRHEGRRPEPEAGREVQ